MNPLEKIATDFRKGVIGRRQSRGRCWMVSAPLGAMLNFMGHGTELVEGTVSGEHHFWLKLPDGRILDATADQFKTPIGDAMPKVYLGKRPSWYCENPTEAQLARARRAR